MIDASTTVGKTTRTYSIEIDPGTSCLNVKDYPKMPLTKEQKEEIHELLTYIQEELCIETTN